MAAIINPANVVWAVGVLFGTASPTNSNALGTQLVDDVPFGILQEVTFKDTLSVKELMGPGSLTAVGVGASERKVTGDAKCAVIRARMFSMIRGAAVTTGSGNTVVTSNQLDEPKVFNLHLFSPSDGSQMQLAIYNCLTPDFDMSFKLRDFTIPNFTYNAYGDPVTGNIWSMILPGSQVAS